MAVPTQAAPPISEPITATPPRKFAGLWSPTVIAVTVWLVGSPIAFVLPTLQRFDPMRIRSWAMVLAPLFLAVFAFVLLGLWRRTRHASWLAPTAAAGLAVWTVFMLRVSLRGTPIPFGGLLGDSGRLTAAATRYASSPANADAWIPGLHAEYPPLFPWIIGRTAALLDIPAWRMVADFEILFASLTILVAFLLWQRLVPAWVALAITVVTFLPAGQPQKSYWTITLAVFVPWVLATFGRPPKGRWHWLPAGVLAGLIVLTYYGWMIWGAFGILALAIATWRSEPDRMAYIRYLLKIAGVTVVVASWYVVPYIVDSLTMPGQTVGDLNPGYEMTTDVFSFLDGVPFLPLALLQVVGFIGLVWLRRSAWWATPLLALVLSALLFRALFTAYFVLTEHSALAGYTPRLYGAALSIGGVLVLVHAIPGLLQRLELTPPREVLVLVVALLVAWCGYNFSKDWMPGAGGRYTDYTQLALGEPRTDANVFYSDYPAVKPSEWFPLDAIQSTVERQYGAAASAHVSLSADERLYAYLPWPGYAVNERGGAAARSRMDDRYAEIHKLATTKNPSAFTRAAQATAFGPIDVFVLRKGEAGWEYSANTGYGAAILTDVFTPDQFNPSDWRVADITGSDFVVIMRLR
jgi:hypothetical protein